MFRLSLKILWHDLKAIPKILATSHKVTLLLLRTTAFLQPTFLSVLLVDGHHEHLASSTEVTLLSNIENHTKTCILALFALHTLLSTLLKFLLHFSPLYSKIWCIHAVLQNILLSRHTRITNWTTDTHVLHKVLHNNQMCNSLIPSRKWVSEFYYIYAQKQKFVLPSSVMLQWVQKLFDHTQ